MDEFSHLHCHTQYSLLDGAARIRRLLARAQEMQIPAVAITDHGNLFGVPEFYTSAQKVGVIPIIGCEFYLAPSGMGDRTDRTRYHQVLLAKTERGYRNLIKLSSLSYTDGYYYKPRIDLDALRRYSADLVATTCCLQGHVPQTILRRGEDEARKVLETYLEIFGDDYYIEIQDHGLAPQKKVNSVLTRWAAEYSIKLVATNDVHYVDQADWAAQDVLLCLQTGSDLSDKNRMRFDSKEFFLKSADSMRSALSDLDGSTVNRALVNTRDVAEKCSFDLPMGDLLMPHYPMPDEFGDDMDAYLRHLVFERARGRYPELSQDVVDRIDHELGIIAEMGYAGYFLIVHDFTDAARRLGVIVGPGRGSAAGSVVAYCLGITNIDPLEYDLLFERFLNPERVSMPDMDIDFDDRGRSKVIDYVVNKYGRESVCQIITFGTMGARSVIRDVSRVLGIPITEADRIAKLVPEAPGMSLERAMKDVPELRALQKSSDERQRQLIQYGLVLEGSARHTGVHAAGVIIAPGNVSDYVPVSIAKGKGSDEDVLTTQYDGKWVEKFGLLKMDFLGLKTLTVINDTVDLVLAKHGKEINVDDIPLDCARAMEIFRRGETVAVFQFESDGMREWLRKLKPTTFDDLIVMNALYRPGPMELIPRYIARKHGEEEVVFPHELLEPILRPTFGIPVYQEQVMQIARAMAGYTLGSADLLRRLMTKKNQAEMDKQRAVFVAGASENDVPEKKALEVFDLVAKFAGYGFNKSHSAAYSLVAFQTAWLKAHYPAEFMAAAMTNEMGDTGRLRVLVEEAQRMGIALLAPSINHSEARFSVDGAAIRFGLGAIKGVGLAAIDSLIEARDREGGFDSLFQMVRSVDLRIVNKKAIESLAACGALDSFGGHRGQLVAAAELAVQYGHKAQADRAAGQNSLFAKGSSGGFGIEPALPSVEPWNKGAILKSEKELTGVYLSGHPLEAFAAEARAFATAEFGVITEADIAAAGGSGDGHFSNRPAFSFCGIITAVQRRTSKSGRPLAFATLDDFTGQGELLIFSNVLDRLQQYLNVDEIVLAKGSAEIRGGSVKVIANDILPMWKVREQLVKSIVLRVPAQEIEEDTMHTLQDLCTRNRGSCKLYFDIDMPDLPEPQRVHSRKFVVDPTPELMKGINKLFGKENVAVLGD